MKIIAIVIVSINHIRISTQKAVIVAADTTDNTE